MWTPQAFVFVGTFGLPVNARFQHLILNNNKKKIGTHLITLFSCSYFFSASILFITFSYCISPTVERRKQIVKNTIFKKTFKIDQNWQKYAS